MCNPAHSLGSVIAGVDSDSPIWSRAGEVGAGTLQLGLGRGGGGLPPGAHLRAAPHAGPAGKAWGPPNASRAAAVIPGSHAG